MLTHKGVLVVGNFLSSSRFIHGVCEDLALQLAASGWRVVTASSKPGRLPRLVDMVTTAWSQRHRYSVAQIDVYQRLAFIWAEAVCWTLQRAGRPYVLSLHGGKLVTFARRWPRRVRHLLSSAAAVTAPSRYMLEQMQPYRADLRLFPNPLNLSVYRFRVRQHPLPHLVWLRAFHAIYNPTLAPKVLAQLAPTFPDVHLTMVGPDKGDRSLQAMLHEAAKLRVANKITLPGGVKKAEVPEWINRGDIFLNTTNVDNTPVSVLEAMASGMCVVSTNVGGIPYLLEDGQDALLVPPDNPEAMASAVRRILTEPRLAESLSQKARQKAEQRDWSLILPKWERLLTAVAEGQQP